MSAINQLNPGNLQSAIDSINQAKWAILDGYEFFKNKNYKTALQLLVDAEGILKLYTDYPIAELYLYMAQCSEYLGDPEEAIRYYARAIEVGKFYDDGDLIKFRCHFNSGILLCKKNDFAVALSHFENAKKITLNDEHSYEVSYHLGGCYQQLGKLQEAWSHFAGALVLGTSAYGESDPKLAKTYIKLAETSMLNKKFDHALGYWEKALEITQMESEEESENLATFYISMGRCNLELGKNKDAIEKYHVALEIYQNLLKQDDLCIADIYGSIAICHHRQGDYTSSLENNLRAFEIRKGISGLEHPKTIQLVLYMARGYICVGMLEEALEHYELACGLSGEGSSQLDKERLASLDGIQKCYEELGDQKKAGEYLIEMDILCEKIIKQSKGKEKEPVPFEDLGAFASLF